VRAELERPPEGLEGLAGVHDLDIAGNRVSCQVDNGALAELLRRLAAAGVRSLVSQPPTLEELFHGQGHPNGGDANGAPPSMSRRGPTWPRWAGLPVARHPGPVRPTAWHGKQPLKCRLPGLPVARVSPASREFPPGRTSALAINEFLLPPGELAQGFLASYFKIFCVIHEIHKKARVIPRERWLSTALSTA
jgi:hypothetical protein